MGYYVNKEKLEKYKSKTYDTPTELEVKWQIHVKYVPKKCYSGTDSERFICPYKEQSSYSTVDNTKSTHIAKIQRIHKNEQQRFYQFLLFYSCDNLLKQNKSYLTMQVVVSSILPHTIIKSNTLQLTL